MRKAFLIFILIFSSALECSEKPYRLMILWAGLGEYESAKRIENACADLGWNSLICYSEESLNDFDRIVTDKPITKEQIEQLILDFQPDLILSLCKDRIFGTGVPNYLIISGNQTSYFDTNFHESPNLLDFAGILYLSPMINKLEKYFESMGKEFHGIPWYLSCTATEYSPVEPKKLFCCGFQWDSKRNGNAFRKAFSFLDLQGSLVVYGPPDRWNCAPNSIRGLLPFDGISICNAIRDAGIALVIHAPSHMEIGAPTARIFEAAAACSVIISDKNPFILKEFGDTVLYIDEHKSGHVLFRQIHKHLKWIQSHPKKAEEMARKAHQIFIEKFTLETQLLNLIHLHEQRMASGWN